MPFVERTNSSIDGDGDGDAFSDTDDSHGYRSEALIDIGGDDDDDNNHDGRPAAYPPSTRQPPYRNNLTDAFSQSSHGYDDDDDGDNDYENGDPDINGEANANDHDDAAFAVADAFDFSELQRENARLKAELARVRRTNDAQNIPAKWPVLHRIECDRRQATYLDRPVVVSDERDGHAHYDSRRRLADERAWELEQRGVPFVVYKTYSCAEGQSGGMSLAAAVTAAMGVAASGDGGGGDGGDDGEEGVSGGPAGRGGGGRFGRGGRRQQHHHHRHQHSHQEVAPVPSREEVRVLSSALRRAITYLFQSRPGLKIFAQDKVFQGHVLRAPYVFLHHFDAEIADFTRGCGRERKQMTLLLEYLREQSADETAKAQTLLAAGLAVNPLIPYLFAPLALLVVRVEEELVVVRQSSLPTLARVYYVGDQQQEEWELTAARVMFDGRFRRVSMPVRLTLPSRNDRPEPFAITDLPAYPLRYGPKELREKLLARGQEFMKCRKGRYVISTGRTDSGEADLAEVRYMVDVQAYELIHGDQRNKGEEEEKVDDADAFEPDEKDDDVVLQMPAKVRGFRMSDKRWINLRIRDLQPVSWNKQAFEDLVIRPEAKELIEALVRNKIEADKGIDFVDGKGTGLVVLLHGGPGTGKTLTAESVAEIAEKPLYRVTCGDIGTDPVAVEEYLESVFRLGRRWGCVVLLDEADVFLEERSHDNLARNALVSVFLRAIEYYDGILILTSNRVGRFDEAFRSRVQLALAYKPLDEEQRSSIWKNFLRKLRLVQEKMDIEEIESRVPELAKVVMNGRQIRNAINTARQLARFKDRPLNYGHLEHVIRVSSLFDTYLEEVSGLDPETMAREKAER